MDFLISIFKSSAYVIIGITALFTAFFVILQLFIFLGKLFDIKALYMPVVEIAEKATIGIVGVFKKFKMVLIVVFLLFVFGFAYVDYQVVSIPIKFEKEKTKRYKAVINRLKDIRIAEDSYKDAKGDFAKTFDELIRFVKYDSLPIVRNLGSYNEDTLTEERALELGIILVKLPDTLTAERAVELGYVVRDTVKIPVAQNIFPKGYVIDSLRYAPYSGVEFTLGSTQIMTGSGVNVKVFEAYDSQPFDKWDTLKVGSLTEANNGAGNWE
jgi:hypothetical protein